LTFRGRKKRKLQRGGRRGGNIGLGELPTPLQEKKNCDITVLVTSRLQWKGKKGCLSKKGEKSVQCHVGIPQAVNSTHNMKGDHQIKEKRKRKKEPKET